MNVIMIIVGLALVPFAISSLVGLFLIALRLLPLAIVILLTVMFIQYKQFKAQEKVVYRAPQSVPTDTRAELVKGAKVYKF